MDFKGFTCNDFKINCIINAIGVILVINFLDTIMQEYAVSSFSFCKIANFDETGRK